MTITGINNSGYTSYYATSYTKTVKKADCEQDSTGTKESNVTTSTVELKTSTAGVTKTEQIKCQTADYLRRFPQIISDGNTCHSLRLMRQKHILSGVTADYRGLISVQLWLD